MSHEYASVFVYSFDERSDKIKERCYSIFSNIVRPYVHSRGTFLFRKKYYVANILFFE